MHYIPERPEEKHLGGNTMGGNYQTFYPRLWAWLVKRLEIKTVLDVGCGEGHAVEEFKRLGIDAAGLDGARRNVGLALGKELFVWRWDLTQHAYVVPDHDVDLVWSCEVVGQIEAQYVDNVVKTLAHGKYLALTHQLPGQQGYHMVNCQPPEYWREKLKAAGMEFDEMLTLESKKYAGYFWQATGAIYKRATA